MKSKLFILYSFLQIFAIDCANAQIALYKLSENYRIYPSSINQTEVFIVRSPLNHNTIFSACNTLNFIPFFISEGIYTSVDGGVSWQGSDTCSGEPIAYHGGDPGIVIDKDGRFIITRLGRTPFVGLYSHYSIDNGQTWSMQQVISTDDLERASVASDAIPGSPYYGRTYIAWVKFALPFPLMLAYTENGAQSWTIPQPINNPSYRSAGGDLAIGPGGELYACWAGVTDVSPFKEILVGFAHTNDGGDNWDVNENAFAMNGITGVLSNKDNIRVNGLPSIAVDTTQGLYRGWIYIVTGEKDLAPAGSDPDIILRHSEDGGTTWSERNRVNQDEISNGKTQYFPSIHIDRYGAVNVLFYDDRYTTSDSVGVMLARSKDGGNTWNEFKVSDHNFKPTPIGGLGQGYQGDNIDLTSTNSSLWPVWMDNSTGLYQIWTTKIDFTEINSILVSNKKDNTIKLLGNFPNPFNSQTTINYQLSEKGYVDLLVYDIYGNIVTKPVSQIQLPGQYSITIHADHFPGQQILHPGLYFYRLSQNGYSETGRMILID